jgi:formamidopyrimidine-DNA glycosylase
MPELPEVEYTARQVRAELVGATIEQVHVFWERTVGYPALPVFLEEMRGRRIAGVRRRAKYLLLDLSGDLLLTLHRRMTGNLRVLEPGWQIDTCLREEDPALWNVRGPAFVNPGYHCICKPLEPGTKKPKENPCLLHAQPFYCRACFDLADGRRLLFNDLRKFGRIELWPRSEEQEALAGLGPEPLEEGFTTERLQEALVGRRRAIKQVLLEQEVVAGLGNIYADEALFYAGIHPLRPANTLALPELELLREGIVAVLLLGIEHGGTSFSNYQGLWGEAGENYNHVRVYQQEGKPCPRCGALIERIVVAQRSTHFCPGCQQPSQPAKAG